MLSALVVLALSAPFPIHWDPELSDDIRRGGYDTAVSEALVEASKFVSASLGIELARAIDVTVYAPANYEKAFGSQAAARWWAHYSAGRVHINGGIPIRGSFTGLLVHELTHAALDVKRHGGQFPTWMNEGMARLLEMEAMGRGSVDDVQRLFLKDALRNREIKPLTGVRAPLDANGYLESFAAVSLLIEQKGRPQVVAFYRGIAEGGSLSAAWTRLGGDETSFAKAFERWVADYRG